MAIPDELRDRVIQDFIDVFQARYGDSWRSKLTTNLRPSPIHQIAELRGVSVSTVKKIRSQLVAMGLLYEVIQTMQEPIQPNTSPLSLEW